ncbi:hypothetical protein LCGC14_1890410 [marine sediment metagenome]|uniref:Uncharacterized protein n=1 Tax=marine sediment metagenome TaxID=412755 RepID=A0A0F9GMV8_9ZZZZ
MMNPQIVINTTIDKVENVLVYIKNCSFQQVKEYKISGKTLFDKIKIQEILKELSKMKGRYIYVIESVGDNSLIKHIYETFSSFNNSEEGNELKISKFNENTSLWDGSPDYHQSFYDIDVLEMLLKDAINS